MSSIVGGHSCWQWEVCLAILAPLFADRLHGNHPNFHNHPNLHNQPNFHNHPNAKTSNNQTIPVVVGYRLFKLLQKWKSIINTTTTTIIPSSKIQTSCLISRGFLTESFHKCPKVLFYNYCFAFCCLFSSFVHFFTQPLSYILYFTMASL